VSVDRSAQIEVFNNQFQSIVNEVATVILRTGHTVFVKETGDFGAALVGPSGEIFAAPTSIGMLRMIGLPTKAAIEASADPRPGDVYLANDPNTTGGMCTHLPDLFVWRPLFHDDELIAWAWSFVHVSDLGGRVPGSISPSSTDIFQEGLVIPPMKLVERGQIDESLLALLAANSRIPDQNLGDLEALLAGLSIAERRLATVCERRGRDEVLDAVDGVLSYAEAHARQLIAAIPPGRYEFWDYQEGPVHVDEPIRIRVAAEVEADELTIDFTGTDPDVLSAYNLPTDGQKAHHFIMSGVVNYFRSLRPAIPYNSGMLRPVHTRIPEGSVLNPRPRAAVGVRAATMHRVYDTILGALAQAMPEAIPAAGSGQGAIASVAVHDPETGGVRVSVVQPLVGGSGGRPGADGIDGMDVCVGNLRNVPVEVIEEDLPVRVERYGLAESSAGAGRWRGGAGVVFEMRSLTPEARVTARGLDRYRFRPWGREGGAAGTLGRTVVNDERSIGRIDVHEMGFGDTIEFVMQGGGGYGDPYERDPELVLWDVQNELISETDALRDYGVVLRGGAVDAEQTRARRAERPWRSDRFAFGDERDRFDREQPDPARTDRARLLSELPPTARDYLRQRLPLGPDYAELREIARELLRSVGTELSAPDEEIAVPGH
jgi:N-methylhydantoinase B